MTSAGAVPIEAIEVGDLVLSRDSATGEQALRPVTELYRNEATELVHVDLGDETITATAEHPFWVEGTGWVDAAELAAGDEVARADSGSATIVSVVREHLQCPVDVYNFEVAEYHTYFVASAGVWVHNACSVRVKGTTRGQHRYHANKQLYDRLTDGSAYAKRMRKKYGDDVINKFIADKGKRNPKGFKWHHDKCGKKRDNYMRLLDDAAHKAWHGKHGPTGGFSQGVKNGVYRGR